MKSVIRIKIIRAVINFKCVVFIAVIQLHLTVKAKISAGWQRRRGSAAGGTSEWGAASQICPTYFLAALKV